MLSEQFKATVGLLSFGLRKVPMIMYAAPVVDSIDESHCSLRVPLTWRTRNHYKSMYIGALIIGVDCAGGLLAQYLIGKRGEKIDLLFKDLDAKFLKRAEDDVVFTCNEGLAIKGLIEKVIATGERQNLPVNITATVPSRSPEPVGRFVLTLSLKKGR